MLYPFMSALALVAGAYTVRVILNYLLVFAASSLFLVSDVVYWFYSI